MRIIDADKLKQHYAYWESSKYDYMQEEKKLFDDIVDQQPTADVVEVVRCKDCKWFNPINNGDHGYCGTPFHGATVYGDDYCSDGERVKE